MTQQGPGGSDIRPWLPKDCPADRLPARAREVLAGELPPDLTPEQRALVVGDWLRWSFDEAANRSWQRLADGGHLDRDRFVAQLMQSLAPGGVHYDLAQGIGDRIGSWAAVQRHAFGWLLRRFEHRAAARIYSRRLLGSNLAAALALVALATVAFCVNRFGHDPGAALAAALGLAVVVAILQPLAGLPWHAYLLYLTPRLGAAVGFGYLFLTSASGAVRAVLASGWLACRWPVALLLLFATAWAYAIFHIYRRVRPERHLPDLLRRSLDVVLLGVFYAAVGALLAAPVLFSPAFLGFTQAELAAHPVAAHHLALFAAIALNLGVVLQLAWEEKPLTEPL
jgi:hypothetical protein